MFQKILVAIDHSAHHPTVFAAALALAQKMNGHLMLLHVLSVDDPKDLALPVFSGYYPTVSEELIRHCHAEQQAIEQRGLELLQALVNQAANTGVKAELTQILGDPSRLICKIAKDWGADLIVMGRIGHSELSVMFMGSVSNYVMHHAPCSVLVVQTQN